MKRIILKEIFFQNGLRTLEAKVKAKVSRDRWITKSLPTTLHRIDKKAHSLRQAWE